MTTSSLRVLALAGLLALGATGCTAAPSAPAAPLTLTVGTDDVEGTLTGAQITHFADEVERISDGAIVVEPQWEAAGSGILDWDQRIAGLVIDGDLDLGWVPTRAWDVLGVDSFRAINTPFLITSDPLLAELVSGKYTEDLLSGLSGAGVVGIDIVPEGLRHPFGYDAALLGPEDYAGGVVRASTSSTVDELFSALGATTTDEDGDPSTQIGAESSYDRAPAQIATGNVTFFPKVNSVVANADWYDGLSSAQKEVLVSAAASTRAWALGAFPADADAAAAFCERGGEIVGASPEQLSALESATAGVRKALEDDPVASKIIAGIVSAAATITAPAPTTSCAASASEESAINGEYTVTTTREELIAGGVTDEAVLDEQAGTYNWTFTDGRWNFTQTTDVAVENPQGSGTYTLKGGVYTHYWSANPGDNTVARLTVLDDGSLQFTEIKDGDPEFQEISAVMFGLKPWTRVAG